MSFYDIHSNVSSCAPNSLSSSEKNPLPPEKNYCGWLRAPIMTKFISNMYYLAVNS